jgi:membrane fusion protein (multidrug efflux system)
MGKKLTTVIAVLGLAAAAGGAWWLQNPTPPASTVAAGGAVGAGGGAPLGRSAGGAGGAAPGRPGAGPGGPVAVEVGQVERMRLVDDAVAVGTVRSNQRVTLRPEVSGRIAALGFAEGKPVRRGQLMVQLDDTLQRAQLQQAEAQASLARTQLQRNRELVGQGFVSQSAVDQSAGALEVAEAQVALARAQLARMRVRAPFDGLAGIRRVDVGEYVKDGAEIVTLEDVSRVWVDYRLPERYLARVRAGLPVEVGIDALGDRSFAGRVEVLDAQVDTEGRAVLVRARLDNRDGALKAGMFARVRTVMGVRDDALVVPEEALVPQGGQQYLIKVVDGPQGKVSQRMEARTGVRRDGRVEIIEGLAVGDLVVVAGQERAMRGDALPLRIVQLGGGGTGGTGGAGRADGAAGAAEAKAGAAAPAKAAAPASGAASGAVQRPAA